MARLSRAEVVDPNEINVVHVINRTVRRCFLFGDDVVTGKNFDYRKVWIEEWLEHFAACFGIDLLCYSILSNHYHLILRTRPDVVKGWDDTEVARRWLRICPRRKIRGKPAEPTEAELNSIRSCPVKLAEIRRRLSDLSWWMRLLNQRVAQRANREDGGSGRFWQDRYRSIRLLDDEAFLACAAYVELNPIRAGIAETLEASDHTSIQRRLKASKSESQSQSESGNPRDGDSSASHPRSPSPASANRTTHRRDAFLAKLTIDEASDPIGPVPNLTGHRCSDKGFFAITEEAYFELLAWTAEHVSNHRSSPPANETPPVLKRVGLEAHAWCGLVSGFGQVFIHLAGRCDRIDASRTHGTSRRFRVRPLARTLLPAPV
jgi:REP element-mobilizing transposase RayT